MRGGSWSSTNYWCWSIIDVIINWSSGCSSSWLVRITSGLTHTGWFEILTPTFHVIGFTIYRSFKHFFHDLKFYISGFLW